MSTSTGSSGAHLWEVLTTARLLSIFKLGIPWPKHTQPNGREWANRPDPSLWSPVCHDALVAISELSLDDSLDMMAFLSDPSSASFPEEALAMMLLLDQAPRMICHGADERWRNDYFDHLAIRFAKQLCALPPSHAVNSKERWITHKGYSFEYWAAVLIFLASPFAHAENIECQVIQSTMVEVLRRETESHYGTTDQLHARDPDMRDSEDTLSFARIARTWATRSGEVADHIFCYCWIMDAHPPIIRVFGRYPYRNAAVGRISTEDEKVFLDQTQHYGEIDEASATSVMDDVQSGVWTPLFSEGNIQRGKSK